ncbi:MAG: rod shape-determining protein RodA, partial [Anaerolineae bacterium]|nr:rod shape-determining protein RodA [Anaerolineae bacterium]
LIDYHYWSSLSRIMYITTVVFLLIIFVYGTARFGSARWLDTGLILIQPSELGKIVIILTLAEYFSETQNEKHDLRWVLQSLMITAGIVVWILLQPNLSTSIVIFVIWFSMLWINKLPVKHTIFFAAVAFVLMIFFVVLIAAGVNIPFIQDYQLQRIVNFIVPDPNARYGDTYNVDQALISIGSGGIFGQGYGHGSQVQLRFLKVRHTDFIFSAMAEEFGFVGTVIVIAFLVFVIFRCLRAARMASDMYGALIAYGFATLIFFQGAVNIGVNLNLIPVTGLTLPFISYGGSSLLSLVLGIGLTESVAARNTSI